jgi:hypothetical protein
MNLLSHIPSVFKNKYLLTITAFAVWMLFFDDRDIITTHFRHTRELKQLQQSKAWYQEQITTTQTELSQLKVNTAPLEETGLTAFLQQAEFWHLR